MKLTIQGHEIELTEQELETLRLQLADETWGMSVVRAVLIGNTEGVRGEAAPARQPTLSSYLQTLAYQVGQRARELNPAVVKRMDKIAKRRS